MKVGIPKEIKNNENRVAITPSGVMELVKNGHQVYVQHTAGVGSGISDKDYEKAGAVILPKNRGRVQGSRHDNQSKRTHRIGVSSYKERPVGIYIFSFRIVQGTDRRHDKTERRMSGIRNCGKSRPQPSASGCRCPKWQDVCRPKKARSSLKNLWADMASCLEA